MPCGMCDPKIGGSLEGFKRIRKPFKVPTADTSKEVVEILKIAYDTEEMMGNLPELVGCPNCQQYYRVYTKRGMHMELNADGGTDLIPYAKEVVECVGVIRPGETIDDLWNRDAIDY